jgi:uncharacterized protein YndB with AHSA1/START domain
MEKNLAARVSAVIEASKSEVWPSLVDPDAIEQYVFGADVETENYHSVTIELSGGREQTRVLVTQDNNADEDERKHSEENWEMMLEGLREVVEG